MVALQELSKDLGLFVLNSRVDMLKAIGRHIACPKGLTQLLLMLSLLRSYSWDIHGKSTHRLYFTVPLRGNTCSGVIQSVCLTQEKSIAPSHKKKYKLLITEGTELWRRRACVTRSPSHLETSRGKQCTLWSKQAVSRRTMAPKMFLGCWLPVCSATRTGSPISRAVLPSPIQRYFHHPITSHFSMENGLVINGGADG